MRAGAESGVVDAALGTAMGGRARIGRPREDTGTRTLDRIGSSTGRPVIAVKGPENNQEQNGGGNHPEPHGARGAAPLLRLGRPDSRPRAILGLVALVH